MTMKSLAIPTYDEAARAFARRELEWYRGHKLELCGVAVAPLNKAGNRTIAKQMLKAYAMQHTLHMMDIIAYACAGDRLAEEAVRELIAEYTDRGEQLPVCLGAYNMDLAVYGPPSHKRGNHSGDKLLRDLVITLIVYKVAANFGLPYVGRHVSACSIVADALGALKIAGVTYHAVKKIWGRWQRAILPAV
jgi:hypothetical protein